MYPEYEVMIGGSVVVETEPSPPTATPFILSLKKTSRIVPFEAHFAGWATLIAGNHVAPPSRVLYILALSPATTAVFRSIMQTAFQDSPCIHFRIEHGRSIGQWGPCQASVSRDNNSGIIRPAARDYRLSYGHAELRIIHLKIKKTRNPPREINLCPVPDLRACNGDRNDK